MRKGKFVSLDIETIGLDPWSPDATTWIVAMYDGKTKTIISDCNGVKESALKTVRKICADSSIVKIIQNAAFDCTYLKVLFDIDTVNIWDTMLVEQVLMGVRIGKDDEEHLKEAYSSALNYILPRYGIKAHSKDIRKKFIDRPKGKKFTNDEIKYATNDVIHLHKIMAGQEYLLHRDKMMEVALLENKTVERTVQMRVKGINFDKKYWTDLADKNEKEYNSFKDKLPKGINWGSHIQVKRYFNSRYGIPVTGIKELRARTLELNIKELTLYDAVQSMAKNVTTYGKNWFEGDTIKPDGRIHPDYSQMVDSGRYSCYNPNLQNQKARSPHRGAFIPSKGNAFVRGDFEGQELAIMAAAAKEKLWIDALLRGDDLHSITASVLYGAIWDKSKAKVCTFPKKCKCPKHIPLRNNAKQLNFTLAYGGGYTTISEKTGLSLFDAKVLVMKYKRIIPAITNWLDNNGKYAVNHSAIYSADPYLRYRRLRVYESEDWHVANQGKNTPVQGAGANMLKLSLISLTKSVPYLCLTVHDEIILDVPKSKALQAAKELKFVMSAAADYITGIKGLVKVEPEITYNLLKS